MTPTTNTVEVRLDPNYPVVVGSKISVGEAVSGRTQPVSCVVVTDSTVGPLHLRDVRESLESAEWSVLTTVEIPAGEASKNLTVYSETLGRVARSGLERDGVVFALGGGVVGDLAGFVAASYMRGVRLVMLPTTLLAMVDSSVGGKVGVDLPEGKNLVGAFHQPEIVVADIARLGTLGPREVSGGLAEVVKMGMLAGGDFFDDLSSLLEPARSGDARSLSRLIEHSVRYKASVVEHDEREVGIRSVLNYGHTIGHGLEAASGYGLSHGEAISLGMTCAARIGARRTATDLTSLQTELLIAAGLPIRVPDVDRDEVLRAMGRDKKRSSKDGFGEHRFVLLDGIGNPVWGVPVTDDEVLESLRPVVGR